MKKLFFNLVMLVSLSVFSQSSTPYLIEHCKDKMTDKEYYIAQKKLICSNSEKTKGFAITPNFKFEKGAVVSNGLMLKNVNIGACDENDKLIILFDDETKITLTSWNKFNCQGNAYFDLTNSELLELSTKKINAIRFSNGRTYENLTVTLTADQKDYFISAYTNFKVVEVDCSN